MKVRKRRRRFNKLIVIYVGIIISVNLIGLGYGDWAASIQLNNTMSTGNVETAFVGEKVSNDNDGRSMNLNMDVAMKADMNYGIVDTTSTVYEGKFEIINNGTLPVAINHEMFQPTNKIKILGLPVNIVTHIEIPPSNYSNGGMWNRYVMPGDKCYGSVRFNLPKKIDKEVIKYIKSKYPNLFNSASNNKEKKVTKPIKETQKALILIPIGCGIWEDVLELNVNINLNIEATMELPEKVNNQGGNDKIAPIPIPDAISGGQGDNLKFEENKIDQNNEQNQELTSPVDNSGNYPITDENQATGTAWEE